MKKFIIVVLVVLVAFLLGPRVEKPGIDFNVPSKDQQIDLTMLNEQIVNSEKNTAFIKPDNQSRIIFADSIPQKTDYCLLYIHGFSASPKEGYPINEEFAQRYHMNAYFPRLFEHGLEKPNNLLNMTPDNLINSAKEAMKIARQLGNKVILMSTSTGGTLSLILASENKDIDALIMYSPNIEIAEDMTKILTLPWGLQIGKLTSGEMIEHPDDSPLEKKYWQSSYRIEAVAFLQSLVENTMNEETFNRIDQAVFLGYYFKDEENQDPTVKVNAMLKMFTKLSTPEELKRKVSFPKAGVHPIASDIKSKDIAGVRTQTFKFAEEILNLKPKTN
jgi:esterase/lipase